MVARESNPGTTALLFDIYTHDMSADYHKNESSGLERMMRGGMVFDEHILRAIRGIHVADKHCIIALTNNFSSLLNSSAGQGIPNSEIIFLRWHEGLRVLFDDFCDSSEVGLR